MAFYVPDQNVEVIIATERPRKVLLPEYFSREVAGLQDSVAGYNFAGSSKTKLGNLPAQEILFVGDIVEEGLVYGQTKTMELISIFKGVSYFFIYRAEISEYSKYLPAVRDDTILCIQRSINPITYSVVPTALTKANVVPLLRKI